MEKGRFSARYPLRKHSDVGGRGVVKLFGMSVSKDIELCIWGEVFKCFGMILVSFDVEDV